MLCDLQAASQVHALCSWPVHCSGVSYRQQRLIYAVHIKVCVEVEDYQSLVGTHDHANTSLIVAKREGMDYSVNKLDNSFEILLAAHGGGSIYQKS